MTTKRERLKGTRRNGCIGLLAAVPLEVDLVIGHLEGRTRTAHGGQDVVAGSLCGQDVVVAAAGVGKTNAAHGTTVLLSVYRPRLVVNFGVGGAFPACGLNAGDLAVADREIYGDEGVLDGTGFRGMESVGIPLLRREGRKYFNVFPLDRRLVKRAGEASRPHAPVLTGAFLTVSTCAGTTGRAPAVMERFHPICENMEGAAVVHVCTRYRVPAVEIRGISNLVGDRDKRGWRLEEAAERCQRAVMEFIRTLEQE